MNEAEDKASEAIRVTRLGFIEKLDGEEVLSAEKKAEIESAFTAFDADNSGMLDKTEFRAALCAIGVALSDVSPLFLLDSLLLFFVSSF